MANLRLTDISSASAVTSDSLIHIVNTGDTSQFSGGSSYKTSLSTVYDAMSGYTAQTINVNNLNIFNVGSTPSISNLGIDVSGNVVYGEDVYVTGGTYSAGTITFTNNSGVTFDVNGLFTGSTDSNTFVTAFTYSSNTLTIFDSSGNTFPVTINEFTGLTATTISATTYQNLPSSVNIYNSDGTLTSNRVVTLAGNTLTFDDDIFVNTITVGEGGTGGAANTILGYEIFNSLNAGQRNVAIGYQSSNAIFDGSENVSVGYLSLSTNTDGNSNVAIGSRALQSNTANSNTSVGFESMSQNSTGTENTALGSKSLSLNQIGDYNVSVGFESLYNNTTGGKNVSIGHTSSYSATTGTQNVSIGGSSLFENVSGSSNVAIGYGSLLSTKTNNNTAVGTSALSTNTSGSGNTAVGYGANVGSGNLTNATAIGANSIVNTSNSLVLGNNANVGIGTSSPTESLDVNGRTKTVNFTMTSGATNGYVLTSDSSGNASWLPSTGGGTFTGGTVTGATIFTGGLSANTISATTYFNLPTDIRVTGATYSNNTFTYTNNTGGTFSVLFNTVTGLTVNGNLSVTGNTTMRAFSGTSGYISGSGQNILTVIGSGNSTTSPLFSIQGSSGELFSVTDSLTGSLFSVNDISGLPILEVFSDNTTLMGSYLAPSLNTTTRLTLTAGTNTVYSIPTSAYTGAFFDYTLVSTGSTGARAGNIMSIWSGSTAQFTESSTLDIGTTTGVTFTVAVSGNNAVLSSSATTTGWTLKTIVRSI